MSQRLITEYKRVDLSLSDAQLREFIDMFRASGINMEQRILDDGDLELILYDCGDKVSLRFQRVDGHYRLTGHCAFKDRNLAEQMRKAMRAFKGKAIMNRIFSSFEIQYEYEEGIVTCIREISKNEERLIYENKDFTLYLKRILNNVAAESEIEAIRSKVDFLLDQRNNREDALFTQTEIDRLLHLYAKRLMELEA